MSDDAVKLATLRAAVQRVLDDEESGEGGWGSDITTVTVLREAMEASKPLVACKCGRPITRCVHRDSCEWSGWYHDEDRSHVCSPGGRVAAEPGGGEEPTVNEPVMPREFAGTIGIEWPPARPHGAPGWTVAFYDADGYVPTVECMVLHASATGITWAELTMFADADGTPVLHVPPGPEAGTIVPWVGDDGEILTGTFPFLITSMRVADHWCPTSQHKRGDCDETAAARRRR